MALSNPYQGIRRPGAVGSPLPGMSVRIQDDGELRLKLPQALNPKPTGGLLRISEWDSLT